MIVSFTIIIRQDRGIGRGGDLLFYIRNSNILLYADDTVIYRNDFCFDKNYRNIQGDLNRLHK